MSDFQIRFEWEDSPRARPPELDATWARLEIVAGKDVLTKVEVARTQSIRTGIYVPLYPIAEWMVANWWFLWNEWRTAASSDRHRLLSAREGFALPDVTFLPSESGVEVRWRPFSVPGAGTMFLSGGARSVPKLEVESEFRRLVEGVLDRLRVRGSNDSYLFEDWRAIQDAERDPEVREFCERSARLGLDPFHLDESVASEIERLGTLLPGPVLDDFCDAIAVPRIRAGAEAIGNFVRSAERARPAAGHWEHIRSSIHSAEPDLPWRQGYRQARALRSYLGLTGPIESDVRDYLHSVFGSLEIVEFDAPARIDAISSASMTNAPVFGLRVQRPEQQRFSLCRAVGDSLSSQEASLVTRSKTEHQQRNRAFAAEFLAPAESIRGKISAERLGNEDVEEIAREFQVSDFVVRHQIENHELATLDA
jgi:hypothetical protein